MLKALRQIGSMVLLRLRHFTGLEALMALGSYQLWHGFFMHSPQGRLLVQTQDKPLPNRNMFICCYSHDIPEDHDVTTCASQLSSSNRKTDKD
jgi:hypothetical protein